MLPVSCLLLSACQLGPAYQKPQTALPSAWDQTLAGAQTGWPSPDWWKAFGSAELDSLMARAQSNNDDLLAAIDRAQEADAQAQIAGAPLYPSLSATGSAGPLRSENQAGAERHRVQYIGQVNASYELDFWGKNRAAYEAAKATADSSRYARDVVWLTISASTATTYFEVLALQDRLRVANNNVAHAQRNLDDLRLEVRQGVVPYLAVVQQQAVVSALQAAIPPLEQQRVAAQTALAILVGELPETFRLHAQTLADLRQPAVTAGQPSTLLERRPDVREAEANLIAASANIRVARAAFFPDLSLGLSGGFSVFTLASRTVPALGIYSLAANVTQPIFQGGALRGQLSQSKARYQELLVGSYRKAVISAYGDVETALTGVKAAQDEAAAQKRAAEDAVASSGFAKQSVSGGFGTILELFTSETAEYSAQDALVQAQLGYFEALVNLTRALGGGWKQ